MTRAVDFVLFDLDGTIINSLPGIHRCVNETLERFELPLLDPAGVTSIIGPPLHETFLTAGVDASDVEDAVADYRSRYEDQGLYEYELYDGIEQVIGHLDDDGVRLAVATSKITRTSRRIIDHAGLADRFELVLGNEPDGTRGTKSEVVADVLTSIGAVPSRTAMVGDRRHDAEGARDNHIRFVGAGWGFAAVGELEAEGALAPLSSPRALLATLGVGSRADATSSTDRCI